MPGRQNTRSTTETTLVAELRAQQAEAARPDAAITANLQELGYGG